MQKDEEKLKMSPPSLVIDSKMDFLNQSGRRGPVGSEISKDWSKMSIGSFRDRRSQIETDILKMAMLFSNNLHSNNSI